MESHLPQAAPMITCNCFTCYHLHRLLVGGKPSVTVSPHDTMESRLSLAATNCYIRNSPVPKGWAPVTMAPTVACHLSPVIY